MPANGGDDMPNSGGRYNRRRSLYVKQNKAYQALLAILIIAFVVAATAVLMGNVKGSSMWQDNVLLRMIIDARDTRRSQ